MSAPPSAPMNSRRWRRTTMMRRFSKSCCFAASITPCRIWRMGWICRWRRTRRGFRAGATSTFSVVPAMPELNHARAQYVVQVHDADRLVGLGHDQGGDLRRVEYFQSFAGEQIPRNRLRVFRHDIVDKGGHQIGAHVAAQIAVGDDADDGAARIGDADATKALR